MGVVQGKLTVRNDVMVMAWDDLAAGDSGQPISMAAARHLTVQAIGDGSAAIEGSNDGVKWKAMVDAADAPLALTGGALAGLLLMPLYLRPVVTGGTGTTVIIVGPL